MNARNRLAALLAAGSLVMALAAVTSAAPPTYGVSLTKSANPANVPSGGGTVVYTVAATATGSGFFGTVNVNDGMAACTLGAPAGDTDADGNLDPGETWSYTCTVNGVTPGTQNTASVNACHNGSGACNQSTHDATAISNTVTVGLGPDITQPPVTQPPVTQPPVTQPPVTQPPVTQPPVTQPPVTQPPVTEPPVTEPPVTEPPVTEPPVTEPPVTEPPVTEPPVTEPPVTEPPVTQAPTFEPVLTDAPVVTDAPLITDAPVVTDAPTFQPVLTQAPVVTDPPASGPVVTDPPSVSDDPTAAVGNDVDATMPSSDTALDGGAARPSDRSWMLVVALGMLLASMIVLNPARTVGEERE